MAVCRSCGCHFERRGRGVHYYCQDCGILERIYSKCHVGPGGCILFTGCKGKSGYGAVADPNTRRTVLAHRAVWESINGSIPDGMCVCHTCDVRNCVNIEHLWLGTNADNTQDRERKGRRAKGEAHPSARLTEAQAQEIKNRVSAGEMRTHLAREYGVAFNTVQAISSGRTWKHLA